eukprot:NODE_1189_length_1532_cov_48.633176_g986_i0.p1 GENE.NODE_1189_length_1532_cov_48.633176_g986_i0~~NODE_1189_length_1532_cov_48.633176_g986_i0.p1  ORF type:complete len:500 (-),score=194.53 NODE_1189_length_1532_cov_48.633176_g986_i0:33-1442(-)
MKQFAVTHPTAKMLVELSKAQDIEAGDGTSSVVVLAGSLLSACENLMQKGIHPTRIAEGFQAAAHKAEKILKDMAIPVEIDDTETLTKAAVTSLSSKVVSSNSSLLAPIAVEAVRTVASRGERSEGGGANVDLNNIRIVKALGGTLDDTELIHGLVFKKKSQGKASGAPTRVEKAKVALIQFQLSPPKTDMENNVIVSDYQQMDRILKEERTYLLEMIKKIKKEGCNVLLIQKSILRDAVTDLSLHFLAQMKIMVITDIERDDIGFICDTLGCKPIAHIDHFKAEKFGSADLVEEKSYPEGKLIKMTGAPGTNTVSVLMRGSSQLVLEEADRSLHDALCVVRCLVKSPFMLPGGSAPELEMMLALESYAQTLDGYGSLCTRAFAGAFEVIPFTLAENAGLRAMQIVSDLRTKHKAGNKMFGVNVRKGTITDMQEESVLQPLLVSLSAVQLATEAVMAILKIDDILTTRM